MATPAQVEANRKNATRSTGPRTEAGKAASRANASTHGLAGTGVVSEEKRDPRFEERRESWAKRYRAGGEETGWALDRLVAASLRIEACEVAVEGLFVSEPERARLLWDEERDAEAARLLAGIDKSPTLVAARLEASFHGVALLLEAWAGLGELLDGRGEWTDEEASLALDLLGFPAHLRGGRTAVDPPDGSNRADHLRGVIAKAIARLDEKIGRLAELDRLEHEQAMSGATTLLSAPARLVLRYEREAWNRYQKARRELEAIPAEVAPIRTAPPCVSAPTPPPKGVTETKPIPALIPKPVAAVPLILAETKPTPAPAGRPYVADDLALAVAARPFEYVDISVGAGSARR